MALSRRVLVVSRKTAYAMHVPAQLKRQQGVASILIVESHADTRDLYAEYFRWAGFTVEVSGTASYACELALTWHPNVIATSLILPDSDGSALCQRLKSDERTRDIPILIVTAHAFSADLVRARMSGADAVLTKPVLPRDLLAEATTLIRRSEHLRARSRAVRERVFKSVTRSKELLRRRRTRR